MDSVSPRPATPDDLRQMLAIESASYPQPWQKEHFTSEMEKAFARILVLTDDETDSTVVGYIVYWIHAEEVSLLNITLSPSWRGFGYARKLMTVMINDAVRDE
ncbi:MAG: GNAT family N-acetyltransferase, partial [Bdellovibrionales bacterium]|nr:GNAT family N-acetyltransferase [Oligoflexia bacterium]